MNKEMEVDARASNLGMGTGGTGKRWGMVGQITRLALLRVGRGLGVLSLV